MVTGSAHTGITFYAYFHIRNNIGRQGNDYRRI